MEGGDNQERFPVDDVLGPVGDTVMLGDVVALAEEIKGVEPFVMGGAIRTCWFSWFDSKVSDSAGAMDGVDGDAAGLERPELSCDNSAKDAVVFGSC